MLEANTFLSFVKKIYTIMICSTWKNICIYSQKQRCEKYIISVIFSCRENWTRSHLHRLYKKPSTWSYKSVKTDNSSNMQLPFHPGLTYKDIAIRFTLKTRPCSSPWGLCYRKAGVGINGLVQDCSIWSSGVCCLC